MYTPLVLIKDFFFVGCSASEILPQVKQLTDTDKQELASAIAREQSIPAEKCGFELIAY